MKLKVRKGLRRVAKKESEMKFKKRFVAAKMDERPQPAVLPERFRDPGAGILW